MAQSARSTSRTIYLDVQSAVEALERLRAVEQRLTRSINDGEAAGKNMALEIARLSNVRNNIRGVQDQLDRGLRPTLQQQQRLVQQLRNELARLSESDPAFQERLRNYQQANAALQRMVSNLRQVNEEGNGGGLSAFTVGAGNLLASGVEKVVDLARQAAQAGFQWALQTEGVKKAYDRLNNPGLLGELRKATKGTVADLDLMKAAVNADNFQLPVEKLGSGLAFAQQRARDTGQSVDYLVESLVTGIARKSPLILDNLGINVTRVNEEFRKTGDFAKAAFTIVDEELAKAGPSVDQMADKVSRFKAAWQNGVTEWAQGALIIASNAFENLEYNFADTQGKIEILQQRSNQKLAEENQRAYDFELKVLADYKKQYAVADEAGRNKIIDQVKYEIEYTRGLEVDAMLRSDKQLEERFAKKLTLWENYLQQLADPAKEYDTIEGIEKELAMITDIFKKAGVGSKQYYDAQAQMKALQQKLNDANGKSAEEAARKEEQAQKKREQSLKQYGELLKRINDEGFRSQLPKAVVPVIEALNKTRDSLQQLEELKGKAKLTDKQYTDGITAIYKRQAEEMAKLTADAKNGFSKIVLNDSTSRNAEPNTHVADMLSAIPKSLVELPVSLMPADVTPDDEKRLKESMLKTLERIKKDAGPNYQLDILRARDPKSLKEALLAQLEYERQEELKNKNLTDSERLVKEEEYQQKRKQIIDQYNQTIMEGITQGLDYLSQAVGILDTFSQAMNSRQQAELDAELANNEKKKTALRKQLDSKLISEQQYNERVAALDGEADTKKKALEKEQFERNKKIQIAQALINGFMGITSVLAARPGAADVFTLGIARALQIAFTVATTAAQIGSIAGQKYGKGGRLYGPSHTSGGMPVINPVTGVKEAEVEGGEVILSKNTVRNNSSVVGALLYNSLNRNGATVKPFWETRSYQGLNYSAVNRSLKYASGGVMFDRPTVSGAVDNASAVQLEHSSAINQALLESVGVLNRTLAAGIPAYVSQKRIDDANAVRQSIQRDSIWD